jgi:hypothetical protein
MNEDRLFETLTRLEAHAAVTNERLAHYNDSLDMHIKRTELLEKDMQVALLPIKSIKFLIGAVVGASGIIGFLKLIGKF